MTKYPSEMNEEELRAFEAVKWNAILAYGGKCVCCGEHRIELLTVDRIINDQSNNEDAMEDATMEKVTSREGVGYYGWLRMKGYPKSYEVLCTNCRMARAVYGYCPHPLARTHKGRLSGSE